MTGRAPVSPHPQEGAMGSSTRKKKTAFHPSLTAEEEEGRPADTVAEKI